MEEITVHCLLGAVGVVGLWVGLTRGRAFELVSGGFIVVLCLRAFVAGFNTDR